MRIRVCLLLLFVGLASAETINHSVFQKKKQRAKKPPAQQEQLAKPVIPKAEDTLPLTTVSSEARTLFDLGFTAWENSHEEVALEQWRKSLGFDHQFAIAHLFISYCTREPLEATRERSEAKDLRWNVSGGERLLIDWIAGARKTTL